MKFKAVDRIALVNKKTMKKLVKYFAREGCTNFDLSQVVNYLVDIAIGELEAIDGMEHVKDEEMNCGECEFLKSYNHTYKNYYCDHEDRIDDMGKLSVDELLNGSPEWCPLRKN